MGIRGKYKSQVEAERAAEQAKPAAEVNVAIVHTKPAQTAEEATANASAADSAAAHLKAQIDALHQSEQMQRQAHSQAADEQRIAAREQAFMQEHPLLLQHPHLTQWAYQAAQRQGHKRGTEELLFATKALVQQEAAKLHDHTPSSAPPPPPPSPPNEEPMPSHYSNLGSTPPEESDYSPQRRIVSAPVSRDGGSYNSKQRITLSPQEREIAKLSGLTDLEYAKQKMRLPEYFAARGRENGSGR